MQFSEAPRGQCPLCGGSSAVLYDGLRDRWCDAPGEWRLERCLSCDLVWREPRQTAVSVADVNTGAYYTHDAPTLAAAESGVRDVVLAATGILPIIREMKRARVMFLPDEPQGTLLDVGCGNGAFLAAMKQRGWRVDGVEPDSAAAELAARSIGTPVFAGELEDAQLEEAQYAAITMSHVIEHVPDPIRTLQTCLRLLRPGGALYLTTPNTRSLGRRVFDQAWLHWDPPRHLHLFTPDNLREAVHRAGFPKAEIRTISRGARWSWQASRAIRASGRLNTVRATKADRVRAAAFHLREYFFGGPAGGEEIFLKAGKPRTAASP